MKKRSLILRGFSFFSLFTNLTSGYSLTFRAAVTKKDFTPRNSQQLSGYGPGTSVGVHDHIYHRIVVLDDGNSQFI